MFSLFDNLNFLLLHPEVKKDRLFWATRVGMASSLSCQTRAWWEACVILEYVGHKNNKATGGYWQSPCVCTVCSVLHVCVHTSRLQVGLGVFLNCSPLPNFLRQGVSLNLEATNWLDWLPTKLQGCSCLYSYPISEMLVPTEAHCRIQALYGWGGSEPRSSWSNLT